MPSATQQETIPYCPACEAWSEMMLALNEVLSVCGGALPGEVKGALHALWQRCNDLTEAAFHCDDQPIFSHPEWGPIRAAAGAGMTQVFTANTVVPAQAGTQNRAGKKPLHALTTLCKPAWPGCRQPANAC